MLTRVRVAGFKAIPPTGIDLELRPLTLLVGPTGSGKSSIIEAIGLLAQSVRTDAKIQLTTSGRLVRLSDATWPQSHVDLLHRHDTEQNLKIEVSLALTPNARPPRVARFGFTAWDLHRGHEAKFEQWLAEGDEEVRFRRELVDGGYNVTAAHGTSVGRVSGEIQRLLDRGLFVPAAGAGLALDGFRLLGDTVARFLTSSSLRYIGPWHGAPLLVSAEPQGSASSAGTFGEHVLRVLAESGTRSSRIREVKKAAARFGLPALDVGVKDGMLAAWFDDPVTKARIPLDHAGSGSQQALPILTDLFDVDPGGTVMVEEIERGSHPAFLIAWGETLAAAVARGAQAIVTTHAPDIVLACALAVKRKQLRAKDIIVHELSRDAEQVRTRAVKITGKGRLSKGFIRSYRDAEVELLGGLLGADEPSGRGRRAK